METLYTQSELDLARLAAYIDGEGTISLDGSERTRRCSDRLKITIVNTDLRLLVWCKDKFGGYIRISNKATKKRRALYLWGIQDASAGELLEKCLPFFVIKREQAELGIAFRKTFSPSNRDPRGLADSVKTDRKELRRKIVEMRASKVLA